MSTGDGDLLDWHVDPDWWQARPSVANFLARPFTVSRLWDIPYLAGYSVDGSEVFIDVDMPVGFTYRGGFIATDDFLCLHEHWEKSIIDAYRAGDHDLPHMTPGSLYPPAHHVATFFEERAVRALIGDDGLRVYNDFMAQNVKTAEGEDIVSCPPNYDLTPFTSPADGGTKLLSRIRRAMRPMGRS